LALFLVATASPAVALQQPGGAPIPSAMGCDSGNPTGLAATFACVCDTPGVCNIGAACPGNQDPSTCDDGQNATCETTLWHDWNDDTCIPSNLSGLDPYTAGAVTPETFMPTCPLTFTVLTRGTARFENAFGWYNATGSRPTPDQLYVMLDCNAQVGSDVVLDVRSDPRYTGGEIGFFLLTPEDHNQSGQCAGGDCCARLDRLSSTVGHVYYSERKYNPDATGSESLIHLVVLDSRITDRKFYFAWEDTFNAANNDFTDLVTSVQGVECAGGGVRCDTGKDGVCGVGLTTCHSGALECKQLEAETDEQCNGIDDDCDGQVDEDATCPNQQVCDQGRCLPNCQVGSEFACPEYAVCDQDTGRCVDPDCEGVTCPEGSVCRGGACVTACDGIVCPHGQSCQNGECMDPCANVVCKDGEVCREGICFAGCSDCAGIVCTSGLVCGAGGDCEDPSCANGCPAGTYCEAGSCLDACDGAACPAGQQCVDGNCCRGSDCPGGDAGPGGGDGGDGGFGTNSPGGGCGCQDGAPGVGALLLLIALALVTRRRHV